MSNLATLTRDEFATSVLSFTNADVKPNAVFGLVLYLLLSDGLFDLDDDGVKCELLFLFALFDEPEL